MIRGYFDAAFGGFTAYRKWRRGVWRGELIPDYGGWTSGIWLWHRIRDGEYQEQVAKEST